MLLLCRNIFYDIELNIALHRRQRKSFIYSFTTREICTLLISFCFRVFPPLQIRWSRQLLFFHSFFYSRIPQLNMHHLHSCELCLTFRRCHPWQLHRLFAHACMLTSINAALSAWPPPPHIQLTFFSSGAETMCRIRAFETSATDRFDLKWDSSRTWKVKMHFYTFNWDSHALHDSTNRLFCPFFLQKMAEEKSC